MRKIILPSFGVLALPIFASSAFAADYRGADAVLKQAAAREESARVAAPAGDKADGSAKLRRDLKGFRETSATLTPEAVAKGWLELADQFARLPREQREERIESGESGDDERLSFQTLVAALPPPAAWDALARAAEARPAGANSAGLRTTLLRLTAHWLIHDNAAQQRDVAALEALAHKIKGPMRQYFTQPSFELKSLLLLNSDDGEAVLKNLNDALDLFANPEAT